MPRNEARVRCREQVVDVLAGDRRRAAGDRQLPANRFFSVACSDPGITPPGTFLIAFSQSDAPINERSYGQWHTAEHAPSLSPASSDEGCVAALAITMRLACTVSAL